MHTSDNNFGLTNHVIFSVKNITDGVA